MPEQTENLAAKYRERLRQTGPAIETCSDAEIEALVADLTRLRESSLHRELGRLTREIHEELRRFANDNRIAELAQDDIPDAKERLNLVVAKTDRAAHQTLGIAEETIKLADGVCLQAQDLHEAWIQFELKAPELPVVAAMGQDLGGFVAAVEDQMRNIHDKMMGVMLAQDFQDVTGQMIRQVMAMVQEIEEKLIRLISISGAGHGPSDAVAPAADEAVGPQLPGASGAKVARSQQDVDELLTSMGF